MREIKFRAWDGDSGEWIDFTDGNYFASVYDTGEFTLRHNDETSNAAIPSHIHVTQYTGLKDKHGVEIFEGDIVEIETHTWKTRFSIYWNDNGASFMLMYSDGDGGNNVDKVDAKYSYEVIGNIYENPELLTKD